MSLYQLSHLTDGVLLHGLTTLVAQDRRTTAVMLAHMAEVDARRLYAPAGYPSMHAYCVDVLRLSEDAAYKRIQASRAARAFPALFDALSEGGLHLTAVCLLAPHLTTGNANELIALATHQRKAEIERRLVERFPRSEVLPLVQFLPPPPSSQLAPTPIEVNETPPSDRSERQLAPAHVEVNGTSPSNRSERQLAPAQVGGPEPRSKMEPIASGRFLLQLMIGRTTYDHLLRAQQLLSHQIPSGDVGEVVDRAMRLLITQLEKRKFGATERAGHRPRTTTPDSRYIPAHIRRAVWKRAGGRCTFVSDTGQRCPAREALEFDHVVPVARGGRSTVDNLRLRCRAHNQYEAERAFGVGFVRSKRESGARRKEARPEGAPRVRQDGPPDQWRGANRSIRAKKNAL